MTPTPIIDKKMSFKAKSFIRVHFKVKVSYEDAPIVRFTYFKTFSLLRERILEVACHTQMTVYRVFG